VSAELEEVFADLQTRYEPGVIAAATTFYFSLGDAAGQKWVVRLTPEAMHAEPGTTDEADVYLKMAEERFLKLIRGEWTPGIADFMTGKVESNDPTKLVVLKDCFT